MELLKAEHITIKKGIKTVLKDVSWTVKSGECWVVFGLNGCGKTTLLSILSGYCSHSDGAVTLFEKIPNEQNILSLRKKIGWASASFFDHYLTTENILDIVLAGKTGSLCCDYSEISDKDIRKAKAILTQLGLAANMRYPYDLLSHGQKQKVLIARALMTEADVYILDEPCNGLDILSKEKLLYFLQQMVIFKKISLIYVTHHTDEILPFFDKALLLKNGAVYAQGNIRNIFQQQTMTDFFETPTQVQWHNNNLSIHLNFIKQETANTLEEPI